MSERIAIKVGGVEYYCDLEEVRMMQEWKRQREIEWQPAWLSKFCYDSEQLRKGKEE